jgi:hypothetical protein
MYAELDTLDLFLCILNVSSFIIVFSYWQLYNYVAEFTYYYYYYHHHHDYFDTLSKDLRKNK